MSKVGALNNGRLHGGAVMEVFSFLAASLAFEDVFFASNLRYEKSPQVSGALLGKERADSPNCGGNRPFVYVRGRRARFVSGPGFGGEG